jgi:hypothetical protein
LNSWKFKGLTSSLEGKLTWVCSGVHTCAYFTFEGLSVQTPSFCSITSLSGSFPSFWLFSAVFTIFPLNLTDPFRNCGSVFQFLLKSKIFCRTKLIGRVPFTSKELLLRLYINHWATMALISMREVDGFHWSKIFLDLDQIIVNWARYLQFPPLQRSSIVFHWSDWSMNWCWRLKLMMTWSSVNPPFWF